MDSTDLNQASFVSQGVHSAVLECELGPERKLVEGLSLDELVVNLDGAVRSFRAPVPGEQPASISARRGSDEGIVGRPAVQPKFA